MVIFEIEAALTMKRAVSNRREDSASRNSYLLRLLLLNSVFSVMFRCGVTPMVDQGDGLLENRCRLPNRGDEASFRLQTPKVFVDWVAFLFVRLGFANKRWIYLASAEIECCEVHEFSESLGQLLLITIALTVGPAEVSHQ